MNAAEIREALHKRWPDGDYVVIEEAPLDPSRQGRKIDLVAISAWKSRGFAVDAVEIKVSMTDWRKELADIGKADGWWTHSDRFWLAVPSEMTAKVRDELPPAWGLLGVSAGVASVVVQAQRHGREPFTWSQSIGLLRAAQDAGSGALQRAESRGFDRGHERGRAEGERESGVEALAELRAKVAAAEEATGIPIATWSNADRSVWGYVSRDDVLAAVKAVVTDDQAVKLARHRLEIMTATLGNAHTALAAALSGGEPTNG